MEPSQSPIIPPGEIAHIPIPSLGSVACVIPWNKAKESKVLGLWKRLYKEEKNNQNVEHPDIVMALVNQGNVFFWVFDEFVVLTSFTHDGYNKQLVIGGVLGKNVSKLYKGCLAAIENWGRSLGCKTAITLSRKAWIRLLPEYAVERYVLRKDL